MSRLTLAFDLDFTLVNVFEGWNAMCKTWSKILGTDVESIREAGARLWSTKGKVYSPELHLWELDPPSEALEPLHAAIQIFYQWIAAGHALYEDVATSMNVFARSEIVECLCVATFGEGTFQSRKFGSVPFPAGKMGPIMVTNHSGRKARLITKKLGRSTTVVLIDDNPVEHREALAHPNVRRIQILRKDDMERSNDAQFLIRSLTELPDILPQLL